QIPHCCSVFCGTATVFNSAIGFHHFPKDETLRKIWIRNVRRDNLVIKRTTTVCSRHFVYTDVFQGGRRCLKEGAVPVLFAWNYYSLPDQACGRERNGRRKLRRNRWTSDFCFSVMTMLDQNHQPWTWHVKN
uniref:THAP domain-containing protein 1 n=1 Tax=Monopterus albus TaxID=43700 RepID=A0A3Q3JGU5_MONAL